MARALPAFCPIYWRPTEHAFLVQYFFFAELQPLLLCSLLPVLLATDLRYSYGSYHPTVFKVIAADGLQTNSVAKRHRHQNYWKIT
jgi:hypothetical protein